MGLPLIFNKYVNTKVTPIENVRSMLWNVPADPAGADINEQANILEQYKLYVEMADRVSARRSLTNTFFLTLNTVIFATIGVAWKDRTGVSPWLLAFPLLAFVVQCGAWFFLVRSYRQLNSAKYTVIGVLEERLPASPYWKAEWTALGEGEDKAKYWPMTHLEQWIPVIFAVIYICAFVAVAAF